MSTETTTEETTKPRRKTAKVDPAKAAEWEAAQIEADTAAAEAVTDARQEAMPPRRFESPLPCKLTEAELVDRGNALEGALSVVDTITAERKMANDGFKARTEIAMERVRELRTAIRTKEESRNVEQIERFDLRRCTAQTLRVDTGEIVSERALRQSELQPELPLSNGENGHAQQMSLGDVNVDDPESLLAAAQKGDEASPSNVTLDNEPDEGDDDNDLDEDD